MHISTSQRLGEMDKTDQTKLKEHVGDESHIVTGIIEAHGATELVSGLGKLDGKIIKLERTASGGISYQLAIFIDEPEPIVVLEPDQSSLSPEQQAVAYFTASGIPEATAKAQVARFGVTRVLAQRDTELAQKRDEREKALDAEFQQALAKSAPAAAPNMPFELPSQKRARLAKEQADKAT